MMANPLDATEDKTEEEKSLDDTSIDVYPEALNEEPEAYNHCSSDPDFPKIAQVNCSSWPNLF